MNTARVAALLRELAAELALHTRFRALRAGGEWYRRGPEIDAFLSTIRGAA